MSRAIYPSLKGKSVVVTGGGSGIGAALTEGFVAQGARVTFLDIADEESKALEASLAGAEIAPTYKRCNLKDVAEIERVFAEIGEVDVLVNNAANDDRHSLEDITPEYWDDRIAVNLRHLAFCAKAVVPGMRAKGAGVIAQRIRRLALENGVPIVERKELARILYKEAEVGKTIPNEQYAAVAEVLRYVYRLHTSGYEFTIENRFPGQDDFNLFMRGDYMRKA